MKFLNLFLLLWVIFALLDPDPDSEYGSGSETLKKRKNSIKKCSVSFYFRGVVFLFMSVALPDVKNMFLVGYGRVPIQFQLTFILFAALFAAQLKTSTSFSQLFSLNLFQAHQLSTRTPKSVVGASGRAPRKQSLAANTDYSQVSIIQEITK
jgi:hypothetical protein